MNEGERKFKIGEGVRVAVGTGEDLVVDSYYKNIYYCYAKSDSEKKLRAFFERELIPSPEK